MGFENYWSSTKPSHYTDHTITAQPTLDGKRKMTAIILLQYGCNMYSSLSVHTNFSTNVCSSGDLTKYICSTMCCFAASFNIFTQLLLTVMAVCSFMCAVFWFLSLHTTTSQEATSKFLVTSVSLTICLLTELLYIYLHYK